MWVRRTAIISHNHHKAKTDGAQLFDHCLRRAHEKEFFIRKAIGWALREYSYANPDGVRDFLLKNRDKLSPLSFSEGAKRLSKAGLMDQSGSQDKMAARPMGKGK
jgi:3-methyladenine DNA glycosylase AlkD